MLLDYGSNVVHDDNREQNLTNLLIFMKIIKIRIKNFRSIKDSGDIEEVTPIFALIGRNNTGKSSFLKAIQILLDRRKVGIEDFHRDLKGPIEISGTILKGFGPSAEEIDLKVVYSKSTLKPEYLVAGKKVATTVFKALLPELLSIDDIRNPDESKAEGQKQTLLNKILKLPSVLGSEYVTKYEELSAELQTLKEKEATSLSGKITKKFQDILNEKNYSIVISPSIDIEKGVSYHTALLDANIPKSKSVDILNSGTGLQSMYILTLLEIWAELSNKNDEAILIIEEPEVYLHPDYQRRMFAAMRRIAENNQVIFTTHSPIMICDIWLTKSVRQVKLNKEGETLIEGVKIEDVIDELGIRYEDVLNPSLIVFVEGEDDITFFKSLGLEHPKMKIIASDGFRAIHCFAFIKIISSEYVNNDFVIITDSDGHDSEERKKDLKQEILQQFGNPSSKLMEKLDSRILVLNKYEIESYFLNVDILKAAFPELEGVKIGSFIKEYESKYEEKKKEVQGGTLRMAEFQKYLKPKKIFEPYGVSEFEKAYKSFWRDKPIFIEVKEEIAGKCAEISTGGTDWFAYILKNVSTFDRELVTMKDAVMERVEE